MRASPLLRSVLSCVLALLLVAALPGLVQAQSNGDGSIYSRFGLGTLETFSSSQSQALGGGAYAVRSLNYNATANPALWSDQVFTRFSGGATFRQVNASDRAGQTSNLTSGSLEALQFSFPFLDRTLGFGAAFQPYTTSNYRIVQRVDDLDLGSQQPESARIDFRGSGGLQRLRTGLGYRINEILSVGATADLIFGTLEGTRQTTFTSRVGTPTLRSTNVADETRLTGVTGSLGAHLTFSNVFAEDDALSIAAAADLPTTLDGDRNRVIEENVERDTLSTIDGEVSLPWRGRLGVAYQPNARWTFVADGVYEPWSNFESTLNDPDNPVFSQSFPVGGEETLTDRWRFSVGTELVPGGESSLAGFFERVAYRVGGYIERIYVRPDRETNVQMAAGTAGLSFPTAAAGTRIDLNLEAGVRGFGDAPVTDTFFGLSFHVNFGERWFQERKFR